LDFVVTLDSEERLLSSVHPRALTYNFSLLYSSPDPVCQYECIGSACKVRRILLYIRDVQTVDESSITEGVKPGDHEKWRNGKGIFSHKVCHPRCVYNKLGCVYAV